MVYRGKGNKLGQQAARPKTHAFGAKVKAIQNKLTKLYQKAYNMSCDAHGGVEDRKFGERRMKGIRSNAPASHQAKLAYYERHLLIVNNEMERVRGGERLEDIVPVHDVIVLQDEEADLVSDPEMDQGDVGSDDSMDVDPGVPIPTLGGGSGFRGGSRKFGWGGE